LAKELEGVLARIAGFSPLNFDATFATRGV